MRSIPRSRLPFIKTVHAASYTAQTDKGEVVVIPTYDIDTDTQGQIVLKIVDDLQDKPQPGDIMTDLKTGATFKIIDPASLIPVRKGPVSE